MRQKRTTVERTYCPEKLCGWPRPALCRVAPLAGANGESRPAGFLPRWPTNRPRRKDHAAPPRDKPLVLAAMDGQRRIVASLDEAASALGLSRNRKALQVQPRDIYIPDLHID